MRAGTDRDCATWLPGEIAGYGRGVASLLRSLGRLHDHRLDGHVGMRTVTSGFHLCDGVNDVHAGDHTAEYRVAIAAGFMVEEIVVDQIDEELRSGAVDVVGARHRQG